MIDRAHLPAQHSSEVRLHLLVAGRTIPLAKSGPGYVVLKDGAELPPCDAEVRMIVDGRRHSWPVRLTHGAVPFEQTVPTEPRR